MFCVICFLNPWFHKCKGRSKDIGWPLCALIVICQAPWTPGSTDWNYQTQDPRYSSEALVFLDAGSQFASEAKLHDKCIEHFSRQLVGRNSNSFQCIPLYSIHIHPFTREMYSVFASTMLPHKSSIVNTIPARVVGNSTNTRWLHQRSTPRLRFSSNRTSRYPFAQRFLAIES